MIVSLRKVCLLIDIATSFVLVALLCTGCCFTSFVPRSIVSSSSVSKARVIGTWRINKSMDTIISRNSRYNLISIYLQRANDKNDEVDKVELEASSLSEAVIVHPVLQQAYPLLKSHKMEFGHPNIPLGSKAGRMCSTIRRLYLQDKLTRDEVSLLANLGFIFLSFDNIYYEANFDDMLQRLIQYEAQNKNNYQIPKKYPYDVQLGAWVTNLRRLGPNSTNISPDHLKQLNQIQFSWTSERKCGSSFMTNLRQVRSALATADGTIDVNLCLKPELRRWLAAQRDARAKGNLNEMRISHIEQLCQEYKIDLSNITK